jgi:transmembrane sensor
VQLVAGDVAHIRGNDVIVHSKSIAAVEQQLSWRQGYLSFDKTTLADAVAEFNRYNKRKIVIADPSIAAIRIGGHFRATNTAGFLRLISSDFAIALDESPDQVVIAHASTPTK